MFSFHKPKVYRSTQGCCICKAKSSSSRFTDSKKYETDFIECFQLSTPRKGEICNACVLLVKRFKRLPPGSDRHWGHVVDARVGPGLKSMTKFKKRKEEQLLQQANGNGKAIIATTSQNLKSLSSVSERFGKIFKKTKKKKLLEVEKRDASPSSDEQSSPSSPGSIPTDSENVYMQFDMDDELENDSHRLSDIGRFKKCQRKSNRPLKNRGQIQASIIDEQFWVRVKTCCGIVYENKLIGAVLVDSTSTTVCPLHKRVPNPTNEVSKVTNGTMHPNAQLDAFNTQVQEMYANNAALKSCSIADSSTNAIRGAKYEAMHQIDVVDTTSIKNNYKLSKLAQSSTEMSSKSFNYLHKIKADSGKITKLPTKLKSSDLNIVKNLVKFCHEKSAKVTPLSDKILSGANSEKLNEVLGTKMNENSSDSGYDEMSNSQELNQKSRIGAIRPVILANGIKLHVQPQNLVLAANLAGISPIHQKSLYKTSTIPAQNQIVAVHQDVMQNVISSTTSNKVEATPSNQTNLNQNLVVIKPKYFQQATN
ncbi:hypothetical protein HA402_002569 [Bradysia odoriphaga]|nr:hypothetical protein HA402_002569 [Bradysia odoriphaga]